MQKALHLVNKWLFGVALALVSGATGAGAEGKETLTLGKADCEALMRWVPVEARPAPGVAYQPGIDARGNAVVGADVDGTPSPIRRPDEITFSIATDLDEKYGIGSSGVFSGEGTLGAVSVRGGQVFWNDQPLDGGDQAAVRAACAQAYGDQ